MIIYENIRRQFRRGLSDSLLGILFREKSSFPVMWYTTPERETMASRSNYLLRRIVPIVLFTLTITCNVGR